MPSVAETPVSGEIARSDGAAGGAIYSFVTETLAGTSPE